MGYICSQFMQGANMCGARLKSNLSEIRVDGRHLPVEIERLPIELNQKVSPEDILVIDENRSLSQFEDRGRVLFDFFSKELVASKIGLIYNQDDSNFINFPDSIPCFVPHQIEGFNKSEKVVPVPWGFTDEGFIAAERLFGTQREWSRIIVNFHPSYNQDIRESVLVALDSTDLSGLQLDTSHRFGEDYSQQLASSGFCLALGGAYYWPKSDHHFFLSQFDQRTLEHDTFPNRSRRIGTIRWDSFRFWEAMAFGCIPIQLNFDLYGLKLPRRPSPWVHYIPLDLSCIAHSFCRIRELLSEQEVLEGISNTIRNWAKKNVHPTVLYNYIISRLT